VTNRDTIAETASAAQRLRQEIKRTRGLAQMSQPALAARIGYSRQYVSHAERSGTLPSYDLIRAIDTALATEGRLVTLWREADAQRRAVRAARTVTPLVDDALIGLVSSPPISAASPALRTPPGRFFAGTSTPLLVLPGADDRGRVLADPATITTQTLAPNQRTLVVAAVDSTDGPRFYGLDKRAARRRLTESATGASLLIPRPYRLDEFTLAILWAVSNLDDALLDDDTELTAAVDRLAGLEPIPRSTLSPEHAPELSPVSRMWLGSNFCARHILRHRDQLTETPQFWTREQRGEEASTWLLFAHKYEYLARLAETSDSRISPPSRSFCIPTAAVSASWLPERILMLLAVALIESVGIRVRVCVESEYSAIQGFVLDRSRRAIVANWVNTDRVWQVDVTDNRPTLREFSDASAWADHHSILTATTPHQRLRALADYLELTWPWLLDRAAGLADYGAAGLIKPRSRLLGLGGLDRACRFLAEARHHAR